MEVRCDIIEYDKYKRALGHCSAGDMNLNAQMVASGHALAYTHYSKQYLPQEKQAKAKRVGIHAGTYVTPWQWRRTH
jgi:endonuclease YncB( thermonuclease family)